MIINYNSENFNELTKERVLVDFYANWCGPCKMIAPELEKISNDIKIIKVDIDKHNDLAREFAVMSIPCLILFENNKEIKRNIGFLPETKLKEFIK